MIKMTEKVTATMVRAAAAWWTTICPPLAGDWLWEVWDFTVPKRIPKNKIPTQTTVVVCRLPQGERHHSGWQFCMVFFESFGCSFNFYEKLRLKQFCFL